MNLMKAFFAAAILLSPFHPLQSGEPLCEKRDAGDGKIEIILANRFFRAVVDPQRGGTVKSFKYHDTELTGESGMLHDLMQDQNMTDSDYHLNAYLFEIQKKGDASTLHLWRRGEKGDYRFVEIHKYISVYKDRSALFVKYDFKVLPEACMNIRISPWFHNFAYTAGENDYYVPSEQGIKKIVHDPEVPLKDVWTDNPARGWSGVVGKNRTGMVFTPEYKRISTFYNWFENRGGTVEWRFVPLNVNYGDSFTTSFIIQPFQGLDEISGAGGGVAGAVSFPTKEKAEITLVAAEKKILKAEAEWIAEGKKDSVKLSGIKTLELNPDTPAVFEIPLSGVKPGNLLRVVLKDEKGNFLADLLKPAGTKNRKFAFMPLEKRIRPEGEDFEWKFRPSFDVVTPHFNFARPYAGGSAKAFFMLSVNNARDMQELHQRFDIVPQYYPMVTGPEIYPFWVPENEAKNIPVGRKGRILYEKSLKELASSIRSTDAEVFLLGDHYNAKYASRENAWTSIPEEARKALVERIRKGGGLIYVNPSKLEGEIKKAFDGPSEKDVEKDIAAFLPPDLLSQKAVKAVKMGKGRIVFLSYRAQGLTPYQKYFARDFAYEELLYSMLGKALIWAASRDIPLRVSVAGENNGNLDISFSGQGADDVEEAKIAVWNFRREPEREAALKIKNRTLNFDFRNSLPDGQHFANLLFLNSKKEIVGWQTVPFKVDSGIRISEMKLNTNALKKGETAKLELELDSKTKAGPLTLDIRCEDVFGRLLFSSSKEIDVKQGKQRAFAEFRIDNPIAILQKLTVTLSNKDRVFDCKKMDFTISDALEKKNYRALLWGNYGGYPNHIYQYVMDAVRDMGFDTLTEGTTWDVRNHCRYPAGSGLKLAHTNLNRVLISDEKPISQYQKTFNKDFLKRAPCLDDPAYRAKIKEKLRETTLATVNYSPEIYMLGDEMSLTTEGGDIPFDVCFSEHTMSAFRDELKNKYGTLKNLNARWKSSFASWEEVFPLTLEEALRNRKFASWLEHRSFMDTVYAKWFGYSGDCIREISPSAYVGESGIQPKISAYGGYDWSKRTAYEDTACFYGFGDMPISFADRHKKVLGSWALGYLLPEARQQEQAWRSLFHGQNMTACWYAGLVVQPDLTLSPYGKAIKRLIGELTQGIGETLSKADYRYSPLAILYSQESCQMALLLKYSSPLDYYKEFRDNLEAWNQNLRDIAFNPKFVSASQIKEGILQKNGYKALVLPCSLILDTETASAIAAFVKAGGLVIADAQTGIYDEYGEKRREGVLDTLFHLKRTEGSMLTPAENRYAVKDGEVTAGIQEKGVAGSNGKLLASARSGALEFGGMKISSKDAASPIDVFECREGKGSIIYLGALRWNFFHPGGNLLRDILRSHGITPELLISEKKNPSFKAEVGHFRDGEIDYFGVMPLIESSRIENASMQDLRKITEDVTIKFPSEGEIYEMRTRKAFGRCSEISESLSPGIARLYALLPRKAEWNVNADATTKAGSAWHYSLSSNIAGLPVCITVQDPDGKELDYLKKIVFAENGNGSGIIPFALNDKKGRWKVTFRDIISGKNKEIPLTLE